MRGAFKAIGRRLMVTFVTLSLLSALMVAITTAFDRSQSASAAQATTQASVVRGGDWGTTTVAGGAAAITVTATMTVAITVTATMIVAITAAGGATTTTSGITTTTVGAATGTTTTMTTDHQHDR